MSNDPIPSYPVRISRISSNHYYLFDPHVISDLRNHYRVPGVLTGTLPQSPQQNLFTGLPVQLMPEEACLLVEQGSAYIVDDALEHRNGFKALGAEGRKAWRKRLKTMGKEVAAEVDRDKIRERDKVLEGMDESRKEKAKIAIRRKEVEVRTESEPPAASITEEENLLFSSSESATRSTPPTSASPTPPPQSHASSTKIQAYAVTPTTSHPPFPLASASSKQALPLTPPSYALYKYLHQHPDHTFYISPGLRFGCQYLVYPGDPLRFHSHFLAASWGWDESFPLLTLVGGGRLGTGVKKGFLIGGPVSGKMEPDEMSESESVAAKAQQSEEKSKGNVRCFTIEWAGM